MTLFMLVFALVLQASPSDPFAVLRDQWARNLHDKNVEASVAEYAEDADFIDPGGHRAHGRTEIRKLFQTVTTTFDSDLTFSSRHVETSGDLAYDSGTYRETLTTRATGKRQESSGIYLIVYRRSQRDGWLIVQHMWAAPPLGQGPK